MAYTTENFRSKKALKETLARATANGNVVTVFQPGPFGPDVADGFATLEGPHYPEPHKWYASCQIKDGAIVPGTVK